MIDILRFALSAAVGFTSQIRLFPELTTSPSSSLPQGPAGIQFSAWLAVFNTADRDTLLKYHDNSTFPYSVASADIGSPEREFILARATGGFNVADVESSADPTSIMVVLREKRRPQYARAAMIVDGSKSNYPVTSFNINPIITPIKFIPKDDPRRGEYERALSPLTPKRRSIVVESIANVVREQYICPKLGEEMITAIKGHLGNGSYDGFEKSEEFSRRLTADMQAISLDKHIHIVFVEPPPQRKGGRGGEHAPQKHYEDLSRLNFGFGPVSLDQGSVVGKTIATLPIHGFLPLTSEFATDWQEIRRAMGDILSGIADADVLLIDLRDNGGGDPHTVAFMLSYILDDGPVHLNDMISRSGSIEESFYTLPPDQLPAGTKRFGGTKPVLVLTTKETISGGEEMAYDLQALKRANAIIGQGSDTTAGAANPVTNPRFICEEEFGKGWWIAGIPNLRPVNSITGTNWEGTGVKSDVVAGRGEWENVPDAAEVGKKLAMRELGSVWV